jgi:hypothetical protein
MWTNKDYLYCSGLCSVVCKVVDKPGYSQWQLDAHDRRLAVPLSLPGIMILRKLVLPRKYGYFGFYDGLGPIMFLCTLKLCYMSIIDSYTGCLSKRMKQELVHGLFTKRLKFEDFSVFTRLDGMRTLSFGPFE